MTVSSRTRVNWNVYLLVNTQSGRTYVGSTTDVQRRLRQHNREIVGGARSTQKGAPHWQIACWISGFDGRSSACRWEKLIKSRSRGYGQRYATMVAVGAMRMCPAYRKRLLYVVPKGLTFNGGYSYEQLAIATGRAEAQAGEGETGQDPPKCTDSTGVQVEHEGSRD